MGLTSIHIHICYFVLTQLILNYTFSGTITGMVRVILHVYISFTYDKAEMLRALG